MSGSRFPWVPLIGFLIIAVIAVAAAVLRGGPCCG